jgi:hypothetical protein
VLGGLAAHQRCSGLATARGDAADELGDADGVETPDGDVIKEGEWLGAGAHDVVGAHRDEIDPDGLEASGASRSGASISESVAAPEPSTWVFIASGIALPVAGAFPRRRLAFLRQR